MSMMTPKSTPNVPTMPAGNEIAVYSTYLNAQKAVDTLSDEGFEVQTVTIVGHDLHMVERVTGRLTYPRAAFAGFASGAWFGLFVGLLMSLFSEQGDMLMILPAIVIGGAFGLLFSVISYALQRGRRDFTSQSQIVAARYVLLCAPQTAGKARSILAEKGMGGDAPVRTTPTVVSRPAPIMDSEPKYGVRADAGQAPPPPTTGPVSQVPPVTGPTGRPLTYGEALDAQRKAAREAALVERQDGGVTAAQGNPVPTAPATDAGDSSAISSTGTDETGGPEQVNQADSVNPTDVNAPDHQAAQRRTLKNPDNPFSPPADD
jgi:hypothetical protein